MPFNRSGRKTYYQWGASGWKVRSIDIVHWFPNLFIKTEAWEICLKKRVSQFVSWTNLSALQKISVSTILSLTSIEFSNSKFPGHSASVVYSVIWLCKFWSFSSVYWKLLKNMRTKRKWFMRAIDGCIYMYLFRCFIYLMGFVLEYLGTQVDAEVS